MTKTYEQLAEISFEKLEDIKPVPFIFESGQDILKYKVPVVTPDGTCSAGHEFEAEPYDLRAILNITNSEHQEKVIGQIQELYNLLEGVQQELKTDWIGIYQTATNKDGVEVLVKLAYQGEPSRAEFPLTKEFAPYSNNTTVGLSGKAIIIESVSEFKGAYYICDGNVNSEACLPIYSSDLSKVIGIVDAESFHDRFFLGRKLDLVAKLCEQLSAYLPI